MSFGKEENPNINIGFRSDIEGLRALAILLVVFYHADMPGFSGGYIGVDVFFVLSGYLITALLVKEAEESGRVDLWRFYARRARRLLPAMALMLAITVPVGALLLAPVEQREYANSAISTAAYLSNIYFVQESTNYLGLEAENNPFLHTWSLSVEEQFYFFWPIFVIISLGAFRRAKGKVSRERLIYSMAAVATFSFAASVYLTRVHQPWAFFMSPLRAWEFALGAMAVLAPPNLLWNDRHSWRKAMGWLGLLGILAAAVLYDKETPFPGMTALLPVLATVLVLRSDLQNKQSAMAAFLNLAAFQTIGRLSYSWYLWHWPILVFAAAIAPDLNLASRLGLLLVSLGIAEISYRFVEDPVRRHAWISSKSSYSLAMAVVITICTVGFSYGWRHMALRWEKLPEYEIFTKARQDIPEIYASGCHARFEDVDIDFKKCNIGEPGARKKMVLFGDSHAAQWYPALTEIMAEDRDWQLAPMTKSGCATVDRPVYNELLKRDYAECLAWQVNALEEMRELRPEVIIYSTSSHYKIPEEEFLVHLKKRILELSRIGKNVIVLADTPSFEFDPLLAIQRKTWQGNIYQNATYKAITPQFFNAFLQKTAAKIENVTLLDLSSEICPEDKCSLVCDGGTIIFRDDDHITGTFARKFASEINRVMEIVERPRISSSH